MSENLAQKCAAFLAPRQHRDFLWCQVTAEHHRAANVSHLRARQRRIGLLDFLLDGQLRIEPLNIGLTEVSQSHVGMGLDVARHRRKAAGNEIQQGRFAFTVVADHAEFIVRIDGQIHTPKQQTIGRVAEREVARLDQSFGGKWSVPKFEIQRFDIGELVEFGKALEHLDARLNQFGLRRLSPKPVDKSLGLSALFLFVGTSFLVDLVFEDDLRVGFRRATLEFTDFLAMDNRGVGCDPVHKIAIVGDQDKLTFEVRQKSRDPANRRDVEVVGRFIKQKQIGFGEQKFGDVDANLKAAGKRLRRVFQVGARKSQPEQNGFGLVDRMRLFFRQSQNRFLQDRWPGEIQVLLEMADAIISRDHYLSGVGVLLSQNKSKESCFAVAVASDQA